MAKFIFGNGKDGSGNPILVGNNPFTGKIKLYKPYNPATDEQESIEFDIESGSVINIDLSVGTTYWNTYNKGVITLDIVEGYKFVGTEFPSEATFTNNQIIYNLSEDELLKTNLNNRNYVAFTESETPVNDGYKFLFGNGKDDSGNPILVGNNPFTGKIVLSTPQNPATEEQKTIEFDIESGSIINIDLNVGTTYWDSYNKGVITLNVVEGYKFIGTEFPSEATFTNNQIIYNLSADELSKTNFNNRNYIAFTESTTPQPSDKPDTILNNYLLTKDELYKFQKQIYDIVALEETENVKTPITDYISNLYVYPFKIPETALYGRQPIKCRNREFNIANQFLKDTISLNLGNILINKVHNNSLDYIGVSCSLYLPFVSGSINLDAQQVIGRELNINYMININDGSTTVNITDVLTDTIINVSKTQLGAIQPFFDFARVTQKDYTPSQSINDIDTAYIIMEMPDYSQTNPTVIVEGSLQGIKGHISINDVTLETTAFNDEKLNIISILSQGVFIK